MDPALEPVPPRATPARGSAAPRETWERQYRSGGWDYPGGPDEAAHYLAIAHLCARHLEGACLLDIGCGTGILLAFLQRHAGMAPSRYSGGVIFNETLYCFDDPVAVLKKSIAQNMHAGSLLIVSRYGEHHEPIWDALAAHCNTLEQEVVANSRGVRWKIRVLRPVAPASA
ncbi:MAG TPA: hypothetical protein VF861_06860 [Telluria sp.]